MQNPNPTETLNFYPDPIYRIQLPCLWISLLVVNEFSCLIIKFIILREFERGRMKTLIRSLPNYHRLDHVANTLLF